MKKSIIIAIAAVVSSIGITYAAHTMSLRTVVEDSKCESGMRCFSCNGTGWRPGTSFKCNFCNGTGANSSY